MTKQLTRIESLICVVSGDEEDKPDAGSPQETDEILPLELTEEQTVWFDAISEGNIVEIKELLDSGSDSAWQNKVTFCGTFCIQKCMFEKNYKAELVLFS